jgi:hypothetical protein
MYARVVRFTDVDPERIEAIKARIAEEGGPPEGVKSTGMKLVHDADQKTCVFFGLFASEEDLKESAKVLEAMDSSDTPGNRASVDAGEIVVEEDA